MHRGGGQGVTGEASSSRSDRGRDIPEGRKDGGASAEVGIGGGARAGPSRMGGGGHQRHRLPQRKHPEPLRRAVHTACLLLTTALPHLLLWKPFALYSPPVISKCVALLKRYLFRYVPRSSTLQQIDGFCSRLIVECNELGGSAVKRTTPWVQPVNQPTPPRPPETPPSPSSTTLAFASAALIKSLIYVRALVACHFPRYSFQPSTSVPLVKPLNPNLPSPQTRSFSNPYDRGLKRSIPEDRKAAKSAAMTIAGLEGIGGDNADYIAADVMKWQWLGGKGQLAWAPLPVMLDMHWEAAWFYGSKATFAIELCVAIMVSIECASYLPSQEEGIGLGQ